MIRTRILYYLKRVIYYYLLLFLLFIIKDGRIDGISKKLASELNISDPNINDFYDYLHIFHLIPNLLDPIDWKEIEKDTFK